MMNLIDKPDFFSPVNFILIIIRKYRTNEAFLLFCCNICRISTGCLYHKLSGMNPGSKSCQKERRDFYVSEK